MADDQSPGQKTAPNMSAKALAEQQARLEREAAALRANLRKRKEQSRARGRQVSEREPE